MTDPADSTLAPAVDEIRQLIRADGGDLTLVSAGPGTVTLRLDLVTANCAECIMPKPYLEQVALQMLQHRGVEVASVTVEDPREG